MEGEQAPSYNVSPTQPVPAVLNEDRDILRWVRWGLIKPKSQGISPGGVLFNARVETVFQKPAFRHAARARRCVIVADGFYEWAPALSAKRQPWFFRQKSRTPLLIAGLWEREAEHSGPHSIAYSCTILTTEAIGPVRPIHHRMPLFLREMDLEGWLSRVEWTSNEWTDFLDEIAVPDLEAYPVGTRVNSTSNNGPDLILPAAPSEFASQLDLFG